DPAQFFHLYQLTKQCDEAVAHTKIDAIIHRILGNEVDLFHPFRCEARDFCYDRFHGTASLLPPHQGDRAEGTIPVTTFGDFYICAVGLPKTETWRVCIVEIRGLADPEPFCRFFGAKRSRQISAILPNSPVPTTPSSSGSCLRRSP